MNKRFANHHQFKNYQPAGEDMMFSFIKNGRKWSRVRGTLLTLILVPTFSCAQMPCEELSKDGKITIEMDMGEMRQPFEEIRQSLPTLEKSSDEEMALIMRSMGDNYYWRHDPIEGGSEAGVLILAHGTNGPNDDLLYEDMKPLSETYLTGISFGMSMMTSKHISCGLNDLKALGADKIYVVPLTESPYNTLISQWKYAFGLEENYSYAEIEKISRKDVFFLEPIMDSYHARKIVYDHALEISSDASNEIVLLVAHGPINPDDNASLLKSMNNISDFVRQEAGFYNVIPISLQDDAAREVRAKNVAILRDIVDTNTTEGRRVLIVTNLMSSGIIQARLREDLAGLEFTFNEKGLVEHPDFVTWISKAVSDLRPRM